MAKQVRNTPVGSTGGAGATTAAPGIGVQFAGATPVEAGYYDVEVVYILTGTTETALANVRLKSMNATLISGLPSITGQLVRLRFPKVQADGTNPISLVAVAAAIASSVYTGAIVYTRVE